MGRPPKPWYWEERGEWCVTIKGVRHKLGPDKEQAETQFHALMAAPPKDPSPPLVSDTVSLLCDRFLDHVERYRAPKTFRWYKDFIQSWMDFGSVGPLRASELRPMHVQAWLDSKPSWGTSTRHGAVAAVTGAIRWAFDQGIIDSNPLARVKCPAIEPRDLVVTEEHYQTMLKKTQAAFRALLQIAWEVGPRPHELMIVEARHMDLDAGTWTFERKKSKGKRQQRVVYLTDSAVEICKAWAKKYSTGPVFRNRNGEPWDAGSVSCRFRAIKTWTGVRYCLYNFRHTFATRYLLAGGDSVALAALMGHRDTTMISRVYAHLQKNPANLRSTLALANASA